MWLKFKLDSLKKLYTKEEFAWTTTFTGLLNFNRQIHVFVYSLFLINIHFQLLYKIAISWISKEHISTVSFLYSFQYVLFENIYSVSTLWNCKDYYSFEGWYIVKYNILHSYSIHTPILKSTHHHDLTEFFSLTLFTKSFKLMPRLIKASTPAKRSLSIAACLCRHASRLKGAQLRLNGLKSLAKLFNFVVFQSVSIFSILNHPCSFMLCFNLFGVFLSL